MLVSGTYRFLKFIYLDSFYLLTFKIQTLLVRMNSFSEHSFNVDQLKFERG